ncbi:hypothetical protein [Terricaulis sp.]|uniref:hypothetical protein n=1 Tax=Terricaulis sp. TaxID=2768686 RepID=UPI0037834874
MKRGLIAALALGFSTLAGVANAQPTQTPSNTEPECERPPYAVTTAEVSVRATAQFQIALAKVLQDRIGSATQGNISLDARIVNSAVGGFAQQALMDTLDNYFCRLRASLPEERRAALDTTQLQAREMMISSFNPVVYNLSAAQTVEERQAEYQEARAENRELRDGLPALRAVMTQAEASAVLPAFNYTTITRAQVFVEGSISPRLQGQVCMGMVRKSIRAVDPSILEALDKMRMNIIWWVSGRATMAEQDWRLLASQTYRRQSRITPEAEQVVIDPQFTTCLADARAAGEATVSGETPTAEATETTAAPATPTPETTTPPATTPTPETTTTTPPGN